MVEHVSRSLRFRWQHYGWQLHPWPARIARAVRSRWQHYGWRMHPWPRLELKLLPRLWAAFELMVSGFVWVIFFGIVGLALSVSFVVLLPYIVAHHRLERRALAGRRPRAFKAAWRRIPRAWWPRP